MTARREVTCTVAEMQEWDEWHGQVVTAVAPLDYRPGWSLVHWRDASDRLPSDLTVTVLRAEPTVEVPVSVIEDVREFIRWTDTLGVHHALQRRILDALPDVEVER